MNTLNERELAAVSGGISIFAPVTLAMTETWGPVGLAFTAGLTIGRYLYDHRDDVHSAFVAAGTRTFVY